jgi:hypothetical protein
VISNSAGDSHERADYVPIRGAHIYAVRGPYSHHGTDRGDGTVVHFGANDGRKTSSAIRIVTLAEFSQGDPIKRREYGHCFPPEMVVARAESMVGRSGYDLFANNCEHFAAWCVVGDHSSAQVETVWSAACALGAGRIVPEVGTRFVVRLGGQAPRSGPNLMSGLSRAGGTALGGVALVAGVGAAVGTGTVMFALRDKPYLTDEERHARRVGRVAGIGGAAIGAGAAVHAVGALGVTGYSAAGLSSGLATLGGFVGGGMATGIAVVAAIPLLLALALAFLAHAFSDRLRRSESVADTHPR